MTSCPSIWEISTVKNHKPISEKKLLANRQNALKSTGPTTEAGKAVASRNATTHGMTAKALPLPPDEQQCYEERTAAFTRAARPADEIEEWLVAAAANASLRVDRCRRCEQAELADRR